MPKVITHLNPKAPEGNALRLSGSKQLNASEPTLYIIGRELNVRKLPGRQWESNPQRSEQLRPMTIKTSASTETATTAHKKNARKRFVVSGMSSYNGASGRAAFSASPSCLSAPEVLLVKRFQQQWSYVDHTQYQTGAEVDEIQYTQ